MSKLLVFSMLLISMSAAAQDTNVFGDCSIKDIPTNAEAPDTELFVLIDQTTKFDNGLKQSVADNVKLFLKPNTSISVTQFSAFTQGHYTEVLMTGYINNDISESERNDISKPLLAKFDQCKNTQLKRGAAYSGMALKKAFTASSSDISKSDVLASLKDISNKVKQSKAKRKVVLLASDMLENSSISSFYEKQSVRQISPEKELEKVEANSLSGDFDGAKVYVIGAGLLPEETKGTYRTPQTIQALKVFWTKWFSKSNAVLVEFGQPALLNSIKN